MFIKIKTIVNVQILFCYTLVYFLLFINSVDEYGRNDKERSKARRIGHAD